MKFSKKTGWFFLVIILIIFFLLLVKLPIFFKIKPVNIPSSSVEIEKYITQSEQPFTELVSGAEKKINWYYQNKKKTEYSIVYLHGYTGCRQDLWPLFEIVAKDTQTNVFYNRFAGHGLNNGEALHLASAGEWLNDGVEALFVGEKLGDKVVLVGFSTGASVAAWLAEKYPNKIAALILISPNFGPADKTAYLLRTPLRKLLLNLLIGPYRTIESEYPLYKKYWIYKYRATSLIDMMEIVALSQKVKWQKIKIPMLIVYTENDDLIDLRKVKNVFKQSTASNKKLVNVSAATSHILAGKIISPLQTQFVAEEIISFMSKL